MTAVDITDKVKGVVLGNSGSNLIMIEALKSEKCTYHINKKDGSIVVAGRLSKIESRDYEPKQYLTIKSLDSTENTTPLLIGHNSAGELIGYLPDVTKIE